MSWEVLKVSTPEELKRFVRLPHRIYRNDPCYIPPLEFERLKFLDARRNPFFEHAEVDHFIVTNAQGQEAGRISTVLDRSFNEYHNERTGFFGMFALTSKPSVAKAASMRTSFRLFMAALSFGPCVCPLGLRMANKSLSVSIV